MAGLTTKTIKDGMYGLIIGDALGVPVEFKDREQLDEDPVVDMCGYGTHNQPKGTWSDDSSMALATMVSITQTRRVHPDHMMEKFADWLYFGKYTPFHKVFDCGLTTRDAIIKFMEGTPAEKCGGDSKWSNGNGSLMRILPVSMYTVVMSVMENWSLNQMLQIVHKSSQITHAHPISLVGCGIYTLVVSNLIDELAVDKAIHQAYLTAYRYYQKTPKLFNALLEYQQIEQLSRMSRDEVSSSGYVVDTLVASLWCLQHGESYKDTLLTAVNLGKDTDTIGAVTGGLAGILYGVPANWKNQLQAKDYVDKIIDDFTRSISS